MARRRSRSRLGRCLLAGVAALALAPACAPQQRSTPYRFRAPVVSGVRAESLPPREPAPAQRTSPHPAATWLAAPEHARTAPVPAPAPADPAAASAAQTASAGSARGPRLTPRALLRSLAGQSSSGGSARFATATVSALGVKLAAPVREARSGMHVLTLARDREALIPAALALTGDLVVFTAGDDLSADADLLIGVVVSAADDAGAVEVVYAPADGTASGRVQRAFVAARGCSGRAAAGAGDSACIAAKRVRAFLAVDRLSAA